MSEAIKEEVIEEGDTIEVPDELMKVMEVGTEQTENTDEGKKDDEKETVQEEGESADAEKAAKDVEPKPETWKPKHNPEYYKEKGRKTKEHIKDLTTRRYEADQRARAAEEKTAELEKQVQELRDLQSRPREDDDRIVALNDAIEVAEEDGNTIVVEALKKERKALLGGPKKEPAPKKEVDTERQEAPQRNPAAQKWMDDNAWFEEKDELGRPKYPQLANEAIHRQEALLATMEIGPALYKRLSEEMESTLEAWGLTKPSEEESSGKGNGKAVEERPRATLQPSRQGGAEKVERTGEDGMTNEEHKRMVAIFRHTKMDPNNPVHRKKYLEQIRA